MPPTPRRRPARLLAEGAAIAADKASIGAAIAAEKACARPRRGEGRRRSRLAETKAPSKREKKKGGKLKKLLLITGLAALRRAFVFKKLRGDATSDNWQSSYVPTPAPAPAPSAATGRLRRHGRLLARRGDRRRGRAAARGEPPPTTRPRRHVDEDAAKKS